MGNSEYSHKSGPGIVDVTVTAVTVIGPQCFASKDGQLINWKGANYVLQDSVFDAREMVRYRDAWLEMRRTVSDIEFRFDLDRKRDASE